jgi:predicted nucleic acid-binding protein
MDKIFLDANVLFSAAYKADARVSRLWALDDVVLCSSRYALEEARFNLSDEDQRARLVKLSAKVQLFDAAHGDLPHGIRLPEKDVPILLAAIEARATHLLTGDVRHFEPYLGKKIAGIAVLLPGEYLRMRRP